MKTLNFLAMDYGASTGRGIVGEFDGDRVCLREVHRFANYFVDNNGTYYWDVFRLFYEMQQAIAKAGSDLGPAAVSSVGIDTWGTDYGLIDKNGQLLGNCRCMRNAGGEVVAQCEKKISVRELFDRTGIQMIYGNTVFQLYERLLNGDPALAHADKMLMMPDLLAYFLTGNKFNEYTMATTSMLYSPGKRAWDCEIADIIGIPNKIFCESLMPGKDRFPVRGELCEQAGVQTLSYVPVGTHDTASAVAAIPLEEDVAFCSSGTWSIFGIESDRPVLSEEAFQANFSNEGTADGKIRLVKNIMGMWILQQCVSEWARQGISLTWDEIVQKASEAAPFQCFINSEELEFYNSGNMIKRIQAFCKRTNQYIPQTVGEIARCVYESLVMRYRYTLDQMEAVTKRRIKALHIVGGGSRNNMLNQFAANVINRPVYAGPVESACIGNVLIQASAFGEISGLNQLRETVKRSFPIAEFQPQDCDQWQEAYRKYESILGY